MQHPRKTPSLMQKNHVFNIFNTKKIPLIGTHRGISPLQTHPENTLKSFFSSDNKHADYIECDVILSKDNTPILFHNKQINTHPINTLTYKELHQKIPHIDPLESLLKTLKPHPKKGLYLELKPYEHTKNRQESLVNKTLDLIQAYTLEPQTLIVSFDPDLLHLTHEKNKKIPLALNIYPNHPLQDHPILPQLSFCCPHITDIKTPHLRKLPRLVWEKSGETLIQDTLKNLTEKEKAHWYNTHNIQGLTTNTVTQILL